MSNKELKFEGQPISNVRWIHRDKLVANDYNPNNVFDPEMRLLKLSILEDGWSIPLVVRDNEDGTFEIIDGFHRWQLSGEPELMSLTGGYVPCVMLDIPTRPRQMMSTIRYNRARGQHSVAKMADIVLSMEGEELPDDRIMEGLGMEKEEVERLRERGNMVKRGSADTFNRGLKPVKRDGISVLEQNDED